ncbi:lysozyme C, milk isozyme [Pogona vitticeps]|uniref:Lysozyme C, milk isozyme-like n=1 Tax=Pogona vitticeps TaxID=103695 RepID=A0A6J0TXX2_9SAUR|nr:lysozyme C, milk isozyme-like [Pogona vitticeps]XP_020653372.1 lysozyme C, milk isozyme-like [Pogona vitticeps]
MILLLHTFLLTWFVDLIQAKLFSRCELAHVLKDNGMDGFENYSLADWICMAFYESGFDTEAVDRHGDGTNDYGIFHINSGWWCEEEGSSKASENLCSVSCSDLLDPEIGSAITCVKTIVNASQGMSAWDGWTKHCQNEDLSIWVKGCKI